MIPYFTWKMFYRKRVIIWLYFNILMTFLKLIICCRIFENFLKHLIIISAMKVVKSFIEFKTGLTFETIFLNWFQFVFRFGNKTKSLKVGFSNNFEYFSQTKINNKYVMLPLTIINSSSVINTINFIRCKKAMLITCILYLTLGQF